MRYHFLTLKSLLQAKDQAFLKFMIHTCVSSARGVARYMAKYEGVPKFIKPNMSILIIFDKTKR